MQKAREICNRRKLGSQKITNYPKDEFESQTKATTTTTTTTTTTKNENLNVVAARLAWQLTKSHC
jgi:hypothetical protein